VRESSGWSCLGTMVAALIIGAASAAAVEPAAATLPAAPAAAHRHATRGTLDERVEALARMLNLDSRQQASVRELLTRQRMQLTQIWEDAGVPAAYRVHATHMLSEQTSENIRALLNEEQKKKFPQPQPASAAPTDALGGRSIDEWISVTPH
jgi:Spy/CpxP family protein refolding chaperone